MLSREAAPIALMVDRISDACTDPCCLPCLRSLKTEGGESPGGGPGTIVNQPIILHQK
jgi:hypothetical protein